MKKFLCSLTVALCVLVCLLTVEASAKKPRAAAPAKKERTSADIKKDKKSNDAKISNIQKDIKTNKSNTRQQLNKLNSINGEIEMVNGNIAALNQDMSRINSRVAVIQDSIDAINKEIAALKHDCSRSLVDARKNRKSLSTLNLIFSSETFYQALRRTGIVRQLQKWRLEKSKRLMAKVAELNDRKLEIQGLKKKYQENVDALNDQTRTLVAKRNEAQGVADLLMKDAVALNHTLVERQQAARSLDRELEDAIRREQKAKQSTQQPKQQHKASSKQPTQQKNTAKAAPAKSTGKTGTPAKQQQPIASAGSGGSQSTAPKNTKPTAPASPAVQPAVTQENIISTFQGNKGRLLFPVSGRYNIVGYFGRNKHPNLSHVMIDNSGIDIEIPDGGKARAVFDGVVSAVFERPDTYHVVMVRHGEYITVYSNIESLSVRKGDKVKTGQTIGKVYSDRSDNNRTILHFEVRHETTKLNPLEWVRR